MISGNISLGQTLKGDIENSMFIKNFKCAKCNMESLEPNSEKTIESYIENDFNMESMILTLEGNPPKRPGYMIFYCNTPNCGYSIQYTEEEILKNLLDDWARMAWKMAKHYMMKSYQFADHKTRFLYDDRMKKFMKIGEKPQMDSLDTAELYKEFAEFLKDEKKKRIK